MNATIALCATPQNLVFFAMHSLASSVAAEQAFFDEIGEENR